jgi:hypothetical protein
MKLLKTKILLSAVLIIALATQCKKATPITTEVVDPNIASYLNMQTHIFKHSCNSSGCHNTAAATNVQHGLVLEGADVYERLINITPKNTDAKLAGLKLLMPGNSDSSFLYAKCNYNNSSFKFGNPMPLGSNALSANEIEFIKQWINAGAPKTGVVADYKLLQGH